MIEIEDGHVNIDGLEKEGGRIMSECVCNVCRALNKHGFPIKGTGPGDRPKEHQDAWYLVSWRAKNCDVNSPDDFDVFSKVVSDNYAEILKKFL